MSVRTSINIPYTVILLNNSSSEYSKDIYMAYTNREIGKIVREYRKKRRLTGGELGARAGISQSKLSKIETGVHATLRHDEIETILNILKVSTPILQQILRSIDSGYQRETLSLYRYFSRDTLDHEVSAKIIRIYCNTTLPLLVQTVAFRKEYATLNGVGNELQNDLKMLTARQDMLWEGTRKYEIIMPQMVLYTVFGSKSVHFSQLDRLERLVAVSNLRIGILPLEVGTAPAEYGSFAVYDDTMAINAMITGEVTTTNKQDIDIHLDIFARLQRMASYDEDAIALIRRAAATLI